LAIRNAHGRAPIRTFIAIELDDAIRKQLARTQDELKSAGAQVKWVEPDHVHLTLKFIGEIPPDQLSEVTGILTECCKGVPPIALTVGGVGAFPSPARPQVVWVGAQPTDAESADALQRLVEALEQWLETIGVPREDRPFKPHLTIGRTKGPKGGDRLAKAIAEIANRPFGEMLAEEIVLLQSTLSPEGPTYTPLQRVRLHS